MKILCIGNSFSEDANAFFYSLATAGGTDVEVLNLSIGGCSFERHAKNVVEHSKEYCTQYNGKFYFDVPCSIDEGLLYKNWDVVTIQQVSGLSGIYSSYFPHISTLIDKIKSVCPKARIVLHQTWAYEKDSVHPDFQLYDKNQDKMHEAVRSTYHAVKDELGLDGLIPSGDVIAKLREYDEFNIDKGGSSLARDGFHLSLTYGRYAAAATWYQALGLGDINENTYLPVCEEGDKIDDGKIALIKKTVKEICSVKASA